jgi:cephalosporin-C deacetylase
MTDEQELPQIRSEVKRPDDFDEFWNATLDELAETPVEWERRADWALSKPGKSVDRIEFRSIGGSTAYAWVASASKSSERRPGLLWLPGYSLGNQPPDHECLYDSAVTLGLNVHGNPPDTPYVHPSKTGSDYLLEGIRSPETYIFRTIVAHCIRAVDVLGRQADIDPDRLTVGGMSQGGGLALIVAALRSDVRLCFSDMPWLCDLDRALSLIDRERYRRLPNLRPPDGRYRIQEYAEAHPEIAEQVYRTYRYFDPLSHADRIGSPVQMTAGGRDPSCKPPTIYAVYNEIRAPKEMIYLPTIGHEIVPEMNASHAKWLQSKLQ